MIGIRSVFEVFKSHKMNEKDYEFRPIFDLNLNLHHKNSILKNSKKAYAAICRPIALKKKPPLCLKFNFSWPESEVS